MKYLNFQGIQGLKLNLVKVTAASVLLIASLYAPQIYAETGEKDGLETVYHIYNNGNYIGGITDEEKVETLIDEKISASDEQFKELNLQVSEEFNMIAERVFEPSIKDEAAIIDQLDEELAIKALTFALTIDGETAVYLKDRAAYEKTIRLMKQSAVTSDEFAEFEKNQQLEENLPVLKADQIRITDIVIEEKVSGLTKQANPEQVKTPENAAEFLLKEKDMTVTVVKEEKKDQKIDFKTVEKEDQKLFKGESKTGQEGKEGKKELTFSIKEQEGKEIDRTEVLAETVVEPVEEIILNGTKEIPEVGTGKFIWPAVDGYISSKKGPRWGRQHKGIDIARPSSFEIKAADHGVVKAAGTAGSFGKRVVIDHGNGYETIYAHLASIDVKVGEKVYKGANIGIMGTTGRSTGIHLHFEISLEGKNKNPLDYVKQ